jgi:hypothetical protein
VGAFDGGGVGGRGVGGLVGRAVVGGLVGWGVIVGCDVIVGAAEGASVAHMDWFGKQN